ncbi:hypothetical protein PG994_009619 [Apiospora phragmitis]|uniref:Uncharacterized protein n=1 Tax=Apiospora phragmitis TaxID=2905665 RepID=A0ABR1U6L6_9PEZI
MPPTTNPHQPSTVQNFLRRIALAHYGFAWILLLAHGIMSFSMLPALGLLPLTSSALLSGLLLYRDALAGPGSPFQPLSAQNVLYPRPRRRGLPAPAARLHMDRDDRDNGLPRRRGWRDCPGDVLHCVYDGGLVRFFLLLSLSPLLLSLLSFTLSF